jgi:hypothetical protein
MNDWVGNIFYFGSPKDGFKVYPDLGAVSNVFDGYSSNTEADWILVARKSEEVTRYTYVKYGLLTAAVDGRTGSCFGISIDFLNHYFTDLKVFRTEIFENIWRAILSDGKLLEIHASSGKVAFKSYDLRDVAPYLEEMSTKIREVIQDKKWSNYVRPAYEIPPAGDSTVKGLHPDSSPGAMSEYFRMYGAVKVSPNQPLEIKSPSEKQLEDRQNLEKRVSELTAQLGQKDRELQTVSQKLERLQASVNAIATEYSPARHTTQTYESHPSANHKGQYPEKVTHHPTRRNDPRTTKILAIVGGLVILVGLVILAKVLFFSEEETTPVTQNTHTSQPVSQPASQPTNQPTASVAPPDPLLIVRQKGKEMAVLNEAVFFEHTRGRLIFDEADFKAVLTSFLFQFSPEVRDFYKGSKDKLWDQILKLNTNSRRNLTSYLKRGQFRIESSAEQQAILRGLVIFVRPS